MALGAWALTAYASFWVRAGAAATQTWLARQWLDRGDTVSGMYHYEEALHADANAARARVGLAQVLAGPRPAQAEEQVAAVLRDRPDDADARFTLAVLRMRAGRPQEAITELRRLVAAAPDYTPAYRLLAQLLYRAGRKAEAIEAYRQALATSPYDDTLRKELAQALAKK